MNFGWHHLLKEGGVSGSLLLLLLAGCVTTAPWPTQQGEAIYRLYEGPEQERSSLATVKVQAPLGVKSGKQYWRGEFAVRPGEQLFPLDFYEHNGFTVRWSKKSIPVKFTAKAGHKYHAFYHDGSTFEAFLSGTRNAGIVMELFDVTEQAGVLTIIIAHPSNQIGKQALSLLSDPDLLQFVARMGAADTLRIKAMQKLDNPEFVKELARDSDKTDIRLDAITLLQDGALLAELIKHPGRDTRIRRAAKKRLASLVASKDRGTADSARKSVQQLQAQALW